MSSKSRGLSGDLSRCFWPKAFEKCFVKMDERKSTLNLKLIGTDFAKMRDFQSGLRVALEGVHTEARPKVVFHSIRKRELEEGVALGSHLI